MRSPIFRFQTVLAHQLLHYMRDQHKRKRSQSVEESNIALHDHTKNLDFFQPLTKEEQRKITTIHGGVYPSPKEEVVQNVENACSGACLAVRGERDQTFICITYGSLSVAIRRSFSLMRSRTCPRVLKFITAKRQKVCGVKMETQLRVVLFTKS